MDLANKIASVTIDFLINNNSNYIRTGTLSSCLGYGRTFSLALLHKNIQMIYRVVKQDIIYTFGVHLDLNNINKEEIIFKLENNIDKDEDKIVAEILSQYYNITNPQSCTVKSPRFTMRHISSFICEGGCPSMGRYNLYEMLVKNIVEYQEKRNEEST